MANHNGMRCGAWGFKTLAKRFRAFINKEAGPPTEDTLAYYDRRVEMAQRFFKEEGIDPKGSLAHELCHHRPVLQSRGLRRCWTCLEVTR